MAVNKILVVHKSYIILFTVFLTIECSYGQTDSTLHQPLRPAEMEEYNGVIPKEISFLKSNKLPIVNFEISTVSGDSFEAPVWIKFYPGGTYDPDGYIVLFEMDMDGDGDYEVSQNTLTGGSTEFTTPGNYTSKVRVTDDKGGIVAKSKSFTIIDPNIIYNEQQIVFKPEEVQKIEDIELDKKLDSIIEKIEYQEDERTVVEDNEFVVKKVEKSKPEKVELDEQLDSIIEEFRYNDEPPMVVKNESDIAYQESVTKEKIIQNQSSGNFKKFDDLSDINPVNINNLVVNGSFEEPLIEISQQNFNTGHNIGGWTISTGAVDIVRTYFKSSHGNQSIDLHGSPGFGSIEQIIKTIPNKRYKVTFDLAGNCLGPPYLKKMQISAAGENTNFEFDCTDKSSRQMGWIEKSWEFIARSNATKIILKTLHNASNASWGPAIDNVKVIEIESEDDFQISQFSKEIPLDNSTIHTTEDSYVYAYSYRNWNDANFGKHDVLSTGWHSTGGEKRTYLKFNIPNINTETLERAVLKLYHSNTIGKNFHTISVHQVLADWQEGIGTFHSGQSEPIDSSGVITWNSQPLFNDVPFTKFKPMKKSKGWIEIDITIVVKEWLNGIPNNGIMLKAEGSLSGRAPISIYEFYSREYKDITKVPVMELLLKE